MAKRKSNKVKEHREYVNLVVKIVKCLQQSVDKANK